jgi:hypothetical protein
MYLEINESVPFRHPLIVSTDFTGSAWLSSGRSAS